MNLMIKKHLNLEYKKLIIFNVRNDLSTDNLLPQTGRTMELGIIVVS